MSKSADHELRERTDQGRVWKASDPVEVEKEGTERLRRGGTVVDTSKVEEKEAGTLVDDDFPDGGLRAWLVLIGVCDASSGSYTHTQWTILAAGFFRRYVKVKRFSVQPHAPRPDLLRSFGTVNSWGVGLFCAGRMEEC